MRAVIARASSAETASDPAIGNVHREFVARYAAKLGDSGLKAIEPDRPEAH